MVPIITAKKDGPEGTIEKHIFVHFDVKLMCFIMVFAILFLATLLFAGSIAAE